MDWNTVILILLKIVAVIVLVFLNGFFVSTEFALVKVRATQLETVVKRGSRRARMALHLSRHLDEYLSACQLGITLASLGLGWIGEPVFDAILQPLFNWVGVHNEGIRHWSPLIIGFSTITFLHIVAGEMAPKSLAIRLPKDISLWVAHPMHWFYIAMYPFIWALNESSLLLLRLGGLAPVHEDERHYSEEELRLLFGAAGRPGESKLSHEIVLNALDLHHRIAREVMRPRQEIVGFDTEAGIAECIELAERTRFSRFPLCEGGDLDRTPGVLHVKDLYAARRTAQRMADLLPFVRKLVYVPENARLERVLQILLEKKMHAAIVVDEFGGTAGWLTLENILEELVGQIQDEFDAEKPLLTKTGEQTWEMDGALPLHDLAALVGSPLEAEGVTTVNGWVTQRLGGFPKPGDVLTEGDCKLVVEAMNGTHVERLKLTRLPA